MATRPTKAENLKLSHLFISIYFNDKEKVIKFKNRHPEIYAKKKHFQIDKDLSFDLTKLTLFNYKVWAKENWQYGERVFTDDDIKTEVLSDDCEWMDPTKPFIRRNREQTSQMIDFWKEDGEILELDQLFPYNHYFKYFSCENPNDPYSHEEMCPAAIKFYLKKGFHEIDLQLYQRVECFDFEGTKKLLEKGANPNIHLDEDYDSSALTLICDGCYFLPICVFPEFKTFEVKTYNPYYHATEMFGDLLGWAAYEDMYDLLSKYR